MQSPRAADWALLLALAGLTLLASFAVGAGAALIVARFPALRGDLTIVSLVELLVYGLASLWLARVTRAQPLARFFALTRVPLGVVVASVALGIALHGPADLVEALVERRWPLSEPELVDRVRRLLPSSHAERALLLAAIAGWVPFAEELFFRGALFGTLAARVSVRSALLMSSICFTLSHAEPRNWLALGVVALVLGFVRASAGSLVPCVLLHGAFNATTLLVLFAHPAPTRAPEPSWTVGLAGTACAALAALALARTGAATGRRA